MDSRIMLYPALEGNYVYNGFKKMTRKQGEQVCGRESVRFLLLQTA